MTGLAALTGLPKNKAAQLHSASMQNFSQDFWGRGPQGCIFPYLSCICAQSGLRGAFQGDEFTPVPQAPILRVRSSLVLNVATLHAATGPYWRLLVEAETKEKSIYFSSPIIQTATQSSSKDLGTGRIYTPASQLCYTSA